MFLGDKNLFTKNEFYPNRFIKFFSRKRFNFCLKGGVFIYGT